MPVRSRVVFACALVAAGLAAACAKAPPPPPAAAPPPVTIAAPPEAAPAAAAPARMTLAAATDTNPDGSGRPSPVVVRIYQLRNDAAFARADFFELYDDEQKTLGPELVTRDEYTLQPDQRRTIDVVFSNETRFIGAIAAYRDYRDAEWRAIVPVPRGRGLEVSVQRLRVVLSPAE